jgi:hypothetical protein
LNMAPQLHHVIKSGSNTNHTREGFCSPGSRKVNGLSYTNSEVCNWLHVNDSYWVSESEWLLLHSRWLALSSPAIHSCTWPVKGPCL